MKWAGCACLLAVLIACGGDDDAIPAECNPLGGAGCVTPWPSALYEVQDANTATGMRLAIPPGALPTNADGVPIDPTRFNERDGFSAATAIFAVFPGGVDGANLVGYDRYPDSLTDASPTVLIDMSTGERVAHFAEVDVNAGDDYDHQAVYIRPAARLHGSTRYAVGIRTSLSARGGGPLQRTEAFAALADGRTTGHARLDAIADRYTDIFAAFDGQSISRDDLVVAWDFTTASDESVTADLLGARDAALAAMGDLAVNMSYDVERDAPVGDGSQIARKIEGTYQSPLVTRTGGFEAGLLRDGDGAPMVTGTMDAAFVVLVPACAAAQRPRPILMFGHGFFGDLQETAGSYMRQIAQDLCIVVVGTEWTGMSSSEVGNVGYALNDMSNLIDWGENIIQGIVNQVTLEQLVRGAMATDMIADGSGTLVDPTRVYFYGISQGHILGSTFLAYDPFIERGVVAVGGGPWSILFERSSHWQDYGAIVGGAYPGPLNKVIGQQLMQMSFDLTENVHVAPTFLSGAMPGTPDKQLLMHMAVGDSQVTNLATLTQARTMGIPVLAPAVTVPYGIDETAGPLPSALVIWDEHPSPLPPETNQLSGVDNGTHGTTRRHASVIEQIGIFLDTGEVVHTCGADTICDCTIPGACDPVDTP